MQGLVGLESELVTGIFAPNGAQGDLVRKSGRMLMVVTGQKRPLEWASPLCAAHPLCV